MNSTPLGKFKAQLTQLMTFLSTALPGDPNIEKAELAVSLGLQSNPRGLVEQFIGAIAPFATQILEGDENFFLGAGASDLGIKDSQTELLMGNIKEAWQKLQEEQQQKVIAYFKLLVMLGTIATQHEGLRQTINQYRDPSNPLVF